MKTEDIDKRIGMPDVDAEWARFEQDVIGKEPKANRRSIYSWIGGLGIAACLLLFFLINIGDEPQPETPVVAEQAEPQPVQQSAAAEVKEIQKEPIVHIVNTPQPKKTPRKKLASANLAFESVNQALQGQIAGLDVVPNPSNLGKGVTMRLRGMTTIDDSIQPLVVLNGKILEIPDSAKIANYDTEEQFASLLGVKPEHITSIYVMKDSSATAKWGEKGANGVIEISTKQHLAHKDVKLEGAIAGFKDLPPQVINLGSGYVMRNLGHIYRIPVGEPLLLFNGELFPDSVKQTLNNMEIGHLGNFFIKFSKQRHQLLKEIKVLKDEEERRPYSEKFGDLANYGVINITTSPDTLCDYYMAQHEELKASRYRISGIVLDEDNKPLPHTMIAVVKEGNKIWGSETADSTGHFAFWAPRTGVEIRFSYVGFYKVVELEPTDKPLTIRMKPTKDLKKLKNLFFE